MDESWFEKNPFFRDSQNREQCYWVAHDLGFMSRVCRTCGVIVDGRPWLEPEWENNGVSLSEQV